MTKHVCLHSHDALRIDPTRTGQLRKRFEFDFRRRFQLIAREILREVVDNGGFGPTLKANRGRFDFPTDQGKVGAFTRWLKSRLDFHIYEGTFAMPRSVAAQQIWMNTYIQTAYRRGIQAAVADVRRGGGRATTEYVEGAFMRPLHADRAGIIFTRAYDGLDKITTDMSTQMGQVLSEGILDGRNPNVIARLLIDRVDKIGLTRARLLARTEVIAAHAEAKLNTYEEAKTEVVGLLSEWLTAGDDRVCEECDTASRDGPYDVGTAHGMIPLHPNCRCTWVPSSENWKEIDLR